MAKKAAELLAELRLAKDARDRALAAYDSKRVEWAKANRDGTLTESMSATLKRASATLDARQADVRKADSAYRVAQAAEDRANRR